MLSGLIYKVAADAQTGGGSSIPGAAIVEDAARNILKSDNEYAPFVIILLAAVVVLAWLLWRQSNANDARLERVVVIAEGYKTLAGTVATALDGMKAVQSASNQALHDLAREAEGEAREGRHGLANIMMVVTNNSELIRALQTQLSNQNDRVNRLLEQGRSA